MAPSRARADARAQAAIVDAKKKRSVTYSPRDTRRRKVDLWKNGNLSRQYSDVGITWELTEGK